MVIERLVRCASMALILGSVLGTPAGLAAPPLQSPAPDAPVSEEPTTLPRCSDLGLAPQPTAGSAPGATTSAGVREAPSPGLSAEEQLIAAQGASTGGFTTEDGPEARSGTGPVACADSPAPANP